MGSNEQSLFLQILQSLLWKTHLNKYSYFTYIANVSIMTFRYDSLWLIKQGFAIAYL